MKKKEIAKKYDHEATVWKGGKFVMGKTTPLWVVNAGNSGNTAVVGIIDKEYSIILLTAYCES